MDKEDYIKKPEDLLNQPTYKLIPADPTTRQKTKLINLLKNIKAEGDINDETYKRMYPTGAWISYILWTGKNSQVRDTPEAYSFKQGH